MITPLAFSLPLVSHSGVLSVAPAGHRILSDSVPAGYRISFDSVPWSHKKAALLLQSDAVRFGPTRSPIGQKGCPTRLLLQQSDAVRFGPIRSSGSQKGCAAAAFGPPIGKKGSFRCCFIQSDSVLWWQKKAALHIQSDSVRFGPSIGKKGSAAASARFGPLSAKKAALLLHSNLIRFDPVRSSIDEKKQNPSAAAPIRFRPLSAKKVPLLPHSIRFGPTAQNETKH